MNNLFVYCEIEDSVVADVSLELLTKGRKLANELGCKLEAIAIDKNISNIGEQIFKYGVDVIHVLDEIIPTSRRIEIIGVRRNQVIVLRRLGEWDRQTYRQAVFRHARPGERQTVQVFEIRLLRRVVGEPHDIPVPVVPRDIAELEARVRCPSRIGKIDG